LAARGASSVGSGNTYYSLQAGAMGTNATITIDKDVSGTSTSLSSYTMASDFAVNTWYTLEFYVHADPTSGVTDLAANVWETGNTAPTGWQISTTDSTTTLQGGGTSGIWYEAQKPTTSTPPRIRWPIVLPPPSAPIPPAPPASRGRQRSRSMPPASTPTFIPRP